MSERGTKALPAVFFFVIGLCLVQPCVGQERGDTSRPNASGAEALLKTGYSILAGTMADMTWPQIEKAAVEGAIVLLPLGVIEEHGPHIGCGADIYQTVLHCRLVQRELERARVGAIIAPPFYWGGNTSTRNFPGSFDITPSTMKSLLTDILANLKRWGFRTVLYVNAHGEGGHNRAILDSARQSRRDPGIAAVYVADDYVARRYGLSGREDHVLLFDYEPPPGGPRVAVPDFHAGAGETGDMIAFFPDLVDRELAKALRAPDVKAGGYAEWGQDARKVTPQGYAGVPSAGDAVWSKEAVTTYCRAMARAIAEFRKKG